jgi:SAM-dependent methyltransferase
METDDHRGRALSFGAVAEDYDRFRPGPPSQALAWLLPVGGGTTVEIGAGTGAFTRLLVGHVSQVIAVEPDRRMAEVLAARVPGASIVAARAEELPLADTCADAVVGSSMWHWVDEERAVFEAARVLRPGGVFGLLWSGWDRSEPWLARLLAQAGADRFRDDEKARDHRHTVHLPAGAPFADIETHNFAFALTVTPDYFVGLVSTYSRFIVLPVAERSRRREALTEVVARYLAGTDEQELRLSMGCTCWSAVRLR